MGDIIKLDNYSRNKEYETTNDLIKVAEDLLMEVRADLDGNKTLRVPITELSTLGAAVSSLIPALNTVIHETNINTQGLYRLANYSPGDVLKSATDGNFWGAFKRADGSSKFLKIKEAEPLSVTTKTVAPIDPATMLMAAALFSIEKELSNIAEVGKQILSFLEVEKESEIEADVETLMSIITKYKFNWDNEHFVTSNHKLVLDIQRTARKNMNSYAKNVSGVLESKKFLIAHTKVNATFNDLVKKFKYYRLALYTFSLASLMEIMLSGNFKEENISGIRDEISLMSQSYRELFSKSSNYLEKMGNSTVEANMLKGIGSAGKAVGKFIGNIPLIKEGSVDEFLQDGGSKLKSSAIKMEEKAVKEFAIMGNPKTGVLIKKMEDMIQIYNHTEKIYFDEKVIYLVAS